MPIFQAENELHYFGHVPKCAGTSIEAHLVHRFGPLAFLGAGRGFDISPQHFTWAQVTSMVPQAWIKSSFAVVRHPLSRFISAYNMRLMQVDPTFPREVTISDFLDWVEPRLPRYPSLLDNHLRPQVDFVGPNTRIFKLEEGLEPVVNYLDRTFGWQHDIPGLGHIDFVDEAIEQLVDFTDHLPNGVEDRVSELFAVDFQRFGYQASTPVRLRVLKPHLAQPMKRSLWKIRTKASQALRGFRK